MFGQSLILSNFVCTATVLDPSVVLVQTKKLFKKRSKSLLEELANSKMLAASECDQSVAECSTVYDNELVKLWPDFANFNEEERSDNLRLDVCKFAKLSFLVKLVLTPNHDQVIIEREFSCEQYCQW